MSAAPIPIGPSKRAQLEALDNDVDLSDLDLLSKKAKIDLIEAIVDGDVERTIEGASTVTLQVLDRDQVLLNSGALGDKVDIHIDGLWFRLATVTKSDRTLTLGFWDRPVAVLKNLPPKEWPRKKQMLIVPASQTTRVAFVRRLVAEGQAIVPIEFITTVDDTSSISSSADKPSSAEKTWKRKPGFPPDADVTVKHFKASAEQLDNLSRVLDVGLSMGLGKTSEAGGRRLLVVAVMVVTQEATAINLSGGDRDSVGLFQQRKSGGRPDVGGPWPNSGKSWPATRDIETDARAFFEVAIYMSQQKPYLTYEALCSEIQRDYTWGTAAQGKDYAQWRAEAEHTVDLYGLPGDETVSDKKTADDNTSAWVPPPSTDTAGMFYRGKPAKPFWGRENDWDCIGRLADEVRWRRFATNGAVYFISESELFRGKPHMRVNEDTDGVNRIDGRYSVGQHNAQVTIECLVRRWAAPPGTVVMLDQVGVFNGRWLVSNIKRKIFDPTATITVKKPLPVLPESKTPEGSTGGTVFFPKPPVPATEYRDPFRDVQTLAPARIDMGVDYAATLPDPIFAIGNGRINYFSRAAGWPGGVFIGYTLIDGPAKDLSAYLAEYVTPATEWKVNDIVTPETILAHFVPGLTFVHNGIETGWSLAGTSAAMAHNVYNHGHATAFGANFSELLTSLNSRNAGRYDFPDDKGHERGTLPTSWPRWTT